jgi:hypothetical protein
VEYIVFDAVEIVQDEKEKTVGKDLAVGQDADRHGNGKDIRLLCEFSEEVAEKFRRMGDCDVGVDEDEKFAVGRSRAVVFPLRDAAFFPLWYLDEPDAVRLPAGD